MLTYEEEDDKWNNWDGGYWGNELSTSYKDKQKGCSSCFKYCCLSTICCTIIFGLLFFIFITGNQLICSLPPILKNSDICNNIKSNSSNYAPNSSNYTNYSINNMSNYTNNISNYTNNYTNNYTDNYTTSNIPEIINPEIINPENQMNINNNTISPESLINKSNFNYSTNFMASQNVIQNDIKNDKKKSIDTGGAIAVSLISVFGFLFIVAGSVYMVKKGSINIKKYCTNKTASKQENIQLTNEELKFYQVKNPLQEAIENNQGGLFQQGVSIIKKAIEKDREREFEEAIPLYNRGIDIIIKCLKSDCNPNDRFVIAKKIDIYVQRVNYITNCVENQKLIKDINNKIK